MMFERIEDRFRLWNEKLKCLLQSLCPPGYELKREYRIFWSWLTISVLYSMQFVAEYLNAYDNLFYRSGQTRVLDMNKKMTDFWILLDESFDLFFLGIFFLLLVFIMHYDYYRRESKSIYVMKRLADKNILRKTYLGTPCVYALIFLITGIVMLLLYYLLYRFMTPQMCL